MFGVHPRPSLDAGTLLSIMQEVAIKMQAGGGQIGVPSLETATYIIIREEAPKT